MTSEYRGEMAVLGIIKAANDKLKISEFSSAFGF